MSTRRSMKLWIVLGLVLVAVAVAWFGKVEVRWYMHRLDHEDAGVRAAAAHRLGGWGNRAAIAKDKLFQCLADPDKKVRSDSLEALRSLGFESEIVPSLIETIKTNRSASSRIRAIEVLAAVGPQAGDAVDALIECLSDTRSVGTGLYTGLAMSGNSETVRRAALKALGAMGPAARPAVVKIVELLPRSALGVELDFGMAGTFGGSDARSAMEALAALGPTAEDAVPTLIALLKMEAQPRPSAQELVGLTPARTFTSGRSPCRSEAAKTLGKIGSKKALPALKSAMADEDPYVRIEAALAVSRIDPAEAGSAKAVLADLAKSSQALVAAKASDALVLANQLEFFSKRSSLERK